MKICVKLEIVTGEWASLGLSAACLVVLIAHIPGWFLDGSPAVWHKVASRLALPTGCISPPGHLPAGLLASGHSQRWRSPFRAPSYGQSQRLQCEFGKTPGSSLLLKKACPTRIHPSTYSPPAASIITRTLYVTIWWTDAYRESGERSIWKMKI